jgi:hypothetical protein
MIPNELKNVASGRKVFQSLQNIQPERFVKLVGSANRKKVNGVP